MNGQPPGNGVRRLSFRMESAADVERFVAEFYGGAVVLPTGDGRDFEVGNETVAAPGFSLSDLWVTAEIDAMVDPVENEFVVDLVQGGRMRLDTEVYGTVVLQPGDVGVLPPEGRFRDLAEDIDLDVVGLDPAALTRWAGQVHGVTTDRVRLTGITPLSGEHARRWAATVVHVRDRVLGNPMLLDGSVALDEAFGLLASRFLETFPNTVLDEVTRRGPARTPALPARLVRRVTEHLRAHAHRPVDPTELARLTGAPARTVLAGLRRAGTDPATVLWRARLHGVRDDLRATGDATAVERIAGRWGFVRPGGFRVAYTRAFGETPEETAGR